MEELLKSDVFFLITSISVVLVTVLFIVVLLYVAKILRDIRKISKKTREEAEVILDDIDLAREEVKKGGKKVSGVLKSLIKKKRKK